MGAARSAFCSLVWAAMAVLFWPDFHICIMHWLLGG